MLMSIDSRVDADEQIKLLILASLLFQFIYRIYCLAYPINTDENACHVLLRVLLQLFDPLGNIVIRISSGQVEHQ